jgi:hypothetical protein
MTSLHHLVCFLGIVYNTLGYNEATNVKEMLAVSTIQGIRWPQWAEVADYVARLPQQNNLSGYHKESSGAPAEDTLSDECRADFGAFLAPITNPLFNRLLPECEGNEERICRNVTLDEPPFPPWGRQSETHRSK